MVRYRSFLAIAAVAVFALAGCSKSSKSAATSTTKGSSTAGTPTTGTPGITSAPATSRPVPKVGAVPWPAPPDPMARTRAAGLVPKGYETLQHHVHSHLDVFVDGVHEVVPAGIGIDIKDPAVHTSPIAGSPGYGGINPPCKQACISPLHTHAVTGILHTESPINVNNTLGEFFVEWNVTLNSKCVGGYCEPTWPIAFYVNGKRYTGDPTKIALTNHKIIVIVIGDPPAKIPTTANFNTD